ncbi:MAG: SpoVR family protein, partial [Alphaproteobacteria bacterium]|nr:SpoVR family protein [Alphaproteobacteria bacterium]
STFNDLWRTVPEKTGDEAGDDTDEDTAERFRVMNLPEENLLYFVETYSPILAPWQRELLSIVRYVAQYFYPQRQTKVMNEGCATFVHHYIANALFDKGLISEGAMLEILHSHSSVVFQPDFDRRGYSGLNPYALGFGMMQDIKRICTEPKPEDFEWFPDIAGCGDWRAVLLDAWANFRDESFVHQYLSPHMIRNLKLFTLADDANERHYTVTSIHDEPGYRKVRESLARSFDIGLVEPDIQVIDADLKGNRELRLQHTVRDKVPLSEKSRDDVLKHLRLLWGYDVSLIGVDRDTEKKVYETRVS